MVISASSSPSQVSGGTSKPLVLTNSKRKYELMDAIKSSLSDCLSETHLNLDVPSLHSKTRGKRGCFWPLGLPENKGCRILVIDGPNTVEINGSYVFPIRIIYSEMCLPLDDIEWGEKHKTFDQKFPAAIELLSHRDFQELEIDGLSPSDCLFIRSWRPSTGKQCFCYSSKFFFLWKWL
ncbi:hypothetical protein OROGR_012754 [Orobanche gracilis]